MGTPGNCVLLVDDSADERRKNRWVLEDAGFDVLEAGNASEAQRLIAARDPSVVLLDLVMPAKTSWELLGTWALEPGARTPPVIALTWSAEEENELLAKELGAAAYVVKPVPPDDLVRLVRRLLQ